MNETNKLEGEADQENPELMLPYRIVEYCAKHADAIYVRAQVPESDGQWQSIALSKLPIDVAIQHVARWVREDAVPVRILNDQKED